ncbi:ROK family protein [Larkinella humicola]|uniref:ROK family protein n=1 Tax=Larkinella humicola TaxID=2607654 RepID=A0A5N1JNK4_9BACT|nr:ROK family protein [Larkinella humicola]KAA9356189.1 ROK family protein [Larkinella humicola]
MNLGIEIGGTKLQLVAGEAAILRHHFRFTVDKSRGAAGILAHIDDTLRQLPEPIQTIGVGFGGPVDTQTGRIATSHQIEGWAGFGLGEWLRQRTSAQRIRVENDANVAALGEALHGAGRTFRQVFYVTLGSGVGGGLVIDGQIYHGMPPGETEIGHLRLDKAGTTLESVCSGWAVDREIREAQTNLPPDSILKQVVGAAQTGEARFLREAFDRGDPTAQRIVGRLADDLAFGLSHAVHLLHPDVIVLGGGLSLTGEPLRSAVERRLPAYLMGAFQPGPAIRLAELGENTVPIGALSL